MAHFLRCGWHLMVARFCLACARNRVHKSHPPGNNNAHRLLQSSMPNHPELYGYDSRLVRVIRRNSVTSCTDNSAVTCNISWAFSFSSYVTPKGMIVIDLTGGASPHPFFTNFFLVSSEMGHRSIWNVFGYRWVRYSESS